jgi:hypothetical protein
MGTSRLDTLVRFLWWICFLPLALLLCYVSLAQSSAGVKGELKMTNPLVGWSMSARHADVGLGRVCTHCLNWNTATQRARGFNEPNETVK